MRWPRRLVKAIVVFVLAAEWYGRGGREFLFGEREETFGVGDTLRTWVPLSDRVHPPTLPVPVKNPQGVEVGVARKGREQQDATDYAGYPVERYEVYVEIDRHSLGHPINVALAQATEWTRSSLASG